MAASATLALKAGVWFRRGRRCMVSPDSRATACPPSGRNSTYRPVQISGASSVYGFVKQSGGHVTIYSEVGKGTSVKLYFPRYNGELSAPDAGIQERLAPRGHEEEVILVVEDNDDVRAYSVGVLGELGYRVLEAADSESGLNILRTSVRIDLLFTDVVLPGKSGRELADL